MSEYSLTSLANNLTEQSLLASQISFMKIKKVDYLPVVFGLGIFVGKYHDGRHVLWEIR